MNTMVPLIYDLTNIYVFLSIVSSMSFGNRNFASVIKFLTGSLMVDKTDQ